MKIKQERDHNGKWMIAIIFENDEERVRVCDQILSMEPKPGAERWYCWNDVDATNEEVANFMEMPLQEVIERREYPNK